MFFYTFGLQRTWARQLWATFERNTWKISNHRMSLQIFMDLHCPLVLPVQFLFESNFEVVKSLLFAVLFVFQKENWYHCPRRSPEWLLHQKSPVKVLLPNLFKEAEAAELQIFHQDNGISLSLAIGKRSEWSHFIWTMDWVRWSLPLFNQWHKQDVGRSCLRYWGMVRFLSFLSRFSESPVQM